MKGICVTIINFKNKGSIKLRECFEKIKDKVDSYKAENESPKEKGKAVESARKALAKLDTNWQKDRTKKKNTLTDSLK